MIPVTDEDKKLIKERFNKMAAGPLTDEEAAVIVRTLKESRRWKQFIRREASPR